MKKYFPATKKQCSTLALGCALVALVALALVNCTDPTPPATFTVKFNTNGGEPAVKEKTIEAGKLLAKPATEPSKEGYTFVGWYKDKALTQVFNFSTEKISQNITLYAKWIEVHTVTFNANGGTNVDPQTVESGKKASKPTDPTRTGYTFVGWYKDKVLTQAFNFSTEKITQNITLYAKWIEVHTVTFDANGGTNVDPQTVESGKKASKPNDPTRTGYTFENWYTDEALTTPFDFNANAITQDTTLYAKWIEVHTVTFDANGGTNVDPQTVESGKKASKPNDPTKTDSLFAGWYTDATLAPPFDFNGTITQDTTLYAKWIEVHTVTFIPNNGEDAISRTVPYGSTVPKPENPTKADSSFAGWYKDQVLTQAFDFTADKVTQDITLYAKWVPQGTALPYTVTFNLNGGEATLTDKAVKDGESLEKPATDPTRTGHTFVGWFSDQALTQAFDFNANTITQDTTLYAKWIPNAYTVTFNYNDGEPQEDLQKKVNHGLTVEDPAPTREGYNLENWYSDENLKSVFDLNAGTITQDTTLYAKWKSNLADIPDVNFRNKLKALIPGAFVGDSLDVTSDEVTGRTTLKVAASSIGDLTGIEYFTGLTNLDCQNNNLTDLDLSKNIQLTKLVCSSNQLTDLDFSSNTALKELDCYGNSLSSLDLSKNIQLTKLVCSSNQLTDLDFSNNRQLTGLACNNNKLTNLNVSSNTALVKLYCYYNELTGLDLSNNTQLVTLWCFYNHLIDLDMRGMRSVTRFIAPSGLLIHHTPIPGLPNEETNVIKTLKVHDNLKDHEQVKKVKTARGDEVKIATYSAADRSTAYTLLCSDYDPTAGSEADRCGDALKYTVAFNSNGGSLVDTLYLYYEGVILKPANPTKTSSFFVGWYKDAGLTQAFNFDTDRITSDTTLYAKWKSGFVDIPDVNFRNKLKALIPGAFVGDSLDVTSDEVTGRTTLNVTSSSIEDLTGIEHFTALKELNCSYNRLTDLDVSRNTQLTKLFCTHNRLTSLDVSKNTALVRLSCHHNQLAYLDVRGMRSDHSKMRRIWYFKIHPFASDPNPKSNAIKVLKVHESLKDHGEIIVEKTARGDEMTIEIYSAAFGSAEYTLVCSNYDPTATGGEENRGVGTCDNEAQDTVVYTVTFDLNGGSSTTAEKTVRAGKLLTQPQPEPTKTDSTFAGWYKDEALTQAFNFSTDNITADITLYAKWVPKGTAVTYTVAFNLNGGMPNEASKTVETGTLLTKPSPDPTKTNSLFLGWYKDAGFAQAFNFDSDPITATITLYARWASNKLTRANRHLLSRLDASRKVTIMEGVVSIEIGAFFNNDLTAVVFPNSLKAIEGSAFERNRLASVTIPDSVTTIGEYAFALNNLTSVVIPDSVTTIGSGAFYANSDLATVTLTKKLYDSLSSDELADRFGRFGSQVATYQTHDGTKLNEDATDASN